MFEVTVQFRFSTTVVTGHVMPGVYICR